MYDEEQLQQESILWPWIDDASSDYDEGYCDGYEDALEDLYDYDDEDLYDDYNDFYN